MLEILFLIWIGRKLAATAKEKGRAGTWAALGVVFWIAGEVMGFVVGELMGLGMGAYALALAMAGIGAGVAWVVVNSLSPQGAGNLGAA